MKIIDIPCKLSYKADKVYKKDIRNNIGETIKLSNDVKVRNFSSPHSFTFTDGTIVPEHTPKMSERFKVIFNEDKDYISSSDRFDWERHEVNKSERSWVDIKLSFELSKDVIVLLSEHMNDWVYDKFDILIVPLPLLSAYKTISNNYDRDIKFSPLRTIRMEDRVKKLCSINKFCY